MMDPIKDPVAISARILLTLVPVWHLAAITLTRGGRCNIAHCPRADIYSNARLAPPSLFRSSNPALSPIHPISPLPSIPANVCLTRLRVASLAFFLHAPSLPPSPPLALAVSFRRAREPLISADFARRADPWNPRGYLSPGGSFLPLPVDPGTSPRSSRIPRTRHL